MKICGRPILITSISFIRRLEWKEMIKWINPRENEKILDIGCGSGELDFKIARFGPSIYGIDLDQNNIELAQRKADERGLSCKFLVGNAEKLPYPDTYFDKVISSSSLEHFEDDIKALKEMERVLKYDGSIILTVDSFTYPIEEKLKKIHQKNAHVINYYDKEEIKYKFDLVGLKLIKSKYLLSSKLTSYFFNSGIKLKWSGLTWALISLSAYPFCFISEKIFNKDGVGYTLIVKGQKLEYLTDKNII